ncbi:MAG: orotate phosphoribosyltransferase [Porphyromonas sp.]|nr:orotate phosphoribosyltransferase [Porphyromonas sp.]
MKPTKDLIANDLLKAKAVKLRPEEPFTWASGWKSPIYCDNRVTLSYPEIRTHIKGALAKLIQEKFPEVTAIAGVATGAIAPGVLVADELGLPFSYIRAKAKDHGMQNQIEGRIEEGAKVVVVEDLISTGGSSLSAVTALRQTGVEVLGMVAIYTHRLKVAEEAFEQAGLSLYTLSNYDAVIEAASETGYVTSDQLETLREWRKNPSEWGK